LQHFYALYLTYYLFSICLRYAYYLRDLLTSHERYVVAIYCSYQDKTKKSDTRVHVSQNPKLCCQPIQRIKLQLNLHIS